MLVSILIAAARLLPGDLLSLVPPCPFRRLTGLLCPLCGGTHSLYHLARGEWNAAWRSNALVPSALVILLVFALDRVTGARLPRLGLRGRRLATAAAVMVVGIFAVARNLIAG